MQHGLLYVVRPLAPETRSAGFRLQLLLRTHTRENSQLETHIFMLPPKFHHINSDSERDFYFQACGSVWPVNSSITCIPRGSCLGGRRIIALTCYACVPLLFVDIARAVAPSRLPTSNEAACDNRIGRYRISLASLDPSVLRSTSLPVGRRCTGCHIASCRCQSELYVRIHQLEWGHKP